MNTFSDVRYPLKPGFHASLLGRELRVAGRWNGMHATRKHTGIARARPHCSRARRVTALQIRPHGGQPKHDRGTFPHSNRESAPAGDATGYKKRAVRRPPVCTCFSIRPACVPHMLPSKAFRRCRPPSSSGGKGRRALGTGRRLALPCVYHFLERCTSRALACSSKLVKPAWCSASETVLAQSQVA